MNVNAKDFQENEFDVTKRSVGIPEEAQNYLDSQVGTILQHRSVNHPFLHWYASNRLREEQEKNLYLETNAYFRYLPFYVANISTITRDEAVLREVLNNSIDELGTKKSHSDIYAQFLEMIGITEDEITRYQPLESSLALNEGIRNIYNTPPLEKALGALFADETQSAVMCSHYNEGLKNQGYDKRVRTFWELHIEAEIGHSNAIYNILTPYISTPEGRELFESGVACYLDLMERFWDEVDALVRISNKECA